LFKKLKKLIYRLIGYEDLIVYYPIYFSGEPHKEIWACECLKTKAIGYGYTKDKAFYEMCYVREVRKRKQNRIQ